ncbi:29706_t:CDS:2, partial [Gigaspora margarita]
ELNLSIKKLKEKLDNVMDRLNIPRISDVKRPIYEENYFIIPRAIEFLLIEGFIVGLEIINTKWFIEKNLKEMFEKFKKKYEHEIKEITYETIK